MLLREGPAYRRDFFCRGLARAGFTISDHHLRDPGPGDALVIWNRGRNVEGTAARYEAAGASVVIAENGYLPELGGKTFALSLSHHNGAGNWRANSAARTTFETKPWREAGDELLLLPQRGIGEATVRMPDFWLGRVTERLRTITKRPVRVRRHPGVNRVTPIEEDLAGVWACITWGSGAGIKAIAAGVPVIHGLWNWIGAPAARRLSAEAIEAPFVGDRDPMLCALSWAQWPAEAIETGEAFRHLMP